MRLSFTRGSAAVMATLMSLLMAACGGGTEPQAVEPTAQTLAAQAQATARPLAAQAQPTMAAALPDARMLFDWAQWKYPDLFPAGPQDYPLNYLGVDYTVRSYPNGNHLGLTSGGEIVGLGPFTNNVLTRFGRREDYAAQVAADQCAVRPFACVNGQAATGARLAVGTGHAVAVRNDGSVIAWGLSTAGQLGNGPAVPNTNARQVATTAVSVAAGAFESLALGRDGIVRGWGRKFGTTIIGGDALATGTDVPSPVPSAFPGGVTQVVTGSANNFGLVLRNDGTVWHLPGEAAAISPVIGGFNHAARQVPGLTDVVALGGGPSGEAMAMRSDGSVWWIRIAGAGAGSWQASATAIAGLSNVAATRCTLSGCLALTRNGSVFMFSPLVSPSAVSGLPPMTQIATSGTSSGPGFVALGSDGRVWNLDPGGAPAVIAGLSDVVEIAGGLQVVLARRTDGSVWGWGSNVFGQLGSNPSSAVPVQVPGISLN